MKNRVMIIGGVQAGKSTLMNTLLGKAVPTKHKHSFMMTGLLIHQ